MTNRLEAKIEKVLKEIKKMEKASLIMNEKGFHVAFSGGKDSLVLLELFKMAEVKYHAEMQLTTVDPPELIRFVRSEYQEVTLNKPKLSMNQLIYKKKILPTRFRRYCCVELKEVAGKKSVCAVGVRKEESFKRSKRTMIDINRQSYVLHGGELVKEKPTLFEKVKHVCVKGVDKINFAPIIDWSENDIWEFITEKKMKYCKLYDEGFNRIGCVCCPLASKKYKERDFEKWPGIIQGSYIRPIQKLFEEGKYRGKAKTWDEEIDMWMNM